MAEIEDELKTFKRSLKDIKDDKIEFLENQSPAEEIVSVLMAFPIMIKDLVKNRNKSETFLRRKIGPWFGTRGRDTVSHCVGATARQFCFRINSG